MDISQINTLEGHHIYQRRGGRGGDIYIGTDSLSPDIKLFVILIKINLCQIDIFLVY